MKANTNNNTNMLDVQQLAGSYQLMPGRQDAIRGGRPVLSGAVLGKLMRGSNAAVARQKLGALFSLCGHAHALAFDLCWAQVQGAAVDVTVQSDTTAISADLHWNTLREHAQRIALDWPRILGAQYAASVKHIDWTRCPLWAAETASSDARTALQTWMQAQDVATIIGQAVTGMASHLQALNADYPLRAVRVQDLVEIAAKIAADDGYVQHPTLNGKACETGPWARFTDTANLHETPLRISAHARLLSRWMEFLRLAKDATPFLQFGAKRISEARAIGWVEMSRGTLVHYLEWDAEKQSVANYRVLAPTEWNLHPKGGLAHAVRSMQGENAGALCLALSACYDPCVQVDVVFSEELEHA